MPRPVRQTGPGLVRGPMDLPALYRDHAGKVRRWAARLGGPELDPDDIVQEVFLLADRRLGRADLAAEVVAWLFRTTELMVRNALRRTRRRRGALARAAELEEARPPGFPTPLELLEQQEAMASLRRLLEAIPLVQRRAFVLFALDGLPTDHIAQLLGVRVGTVRVWIHRARAAVRNLEGGGGHQGDERNPP